MSKIKNIFNLTKILFLNSFQNPYIIDQKTNKINKKSVFVWLLIILSIAITYLSYEIISELARVGQPEIFLNVFFLIVMMIMIFQIILASTNVYFFSKDFEILLPLPIKTDELLISKFNTILINLYFSELIFVLFPLIVYGICTYAGIIYYFYLFLILIIFPILPTLFISLIMMFFIKLSKFIKNKDIFQIIFTLFCIIIVFILEFKIGNMLIKKIDNNSNIQTENIVEAINEFNNNLNKTYNYFLEINPTINILKNSNKINSLFYLFEIIFIDLIFFILFILIGKKYYLKNILKNNNNYYLNKISKNKIEKKLKKKNICHSYINKEFKILFKNPMFFMQCIFPMFILMVSILIIVIVALPNLRLLLTSDIFGNTIAFSVDLGVICLVLGIIQFVFTMSNISITALSREGNSANYMKFIPIDFYKQFIYKSIPQIIINMFFSIIILILIKLIFVEFNFIYLFFIFIISNLLNIINSELMVLVDFYKPNLKWKTEYETVKNDNKLFQYVLTIFIILILVYFNKIFKDLNLNISCFLIILILVLLIFIINKIIKININKLFEKINN